ncbi:MAG: hypothetical protein ABIG39_07640 [Candidatus Micrarchaeota archaeon]
MNLNKLLILLVFVCVFTPNLSFADSALQVTDYSLIPQTVYQGSKGYIQVTIGNTGSDTATGITIQYSNNFDYDVKSMSTGDININSNSKVSIPFNVPAEFNSGVLLYKIEVYYQSSGSGGGSKLTTSSIPIVISQNEILEVNTLSLSRKTISPGEKLSIELDVSNIGGTINNLAITTPSDSSFSIDGSTRKSIGNLQSNTTKTVTLNLASSSLTTLGQYMIPLTFTYEDSLQNTVAQTLYVGPISVLDSSTQFRVNLVPLTPTEIGSQAVFQLQLKNTGANAVSAIVDVGSTKTFIPLGTNRVYFDSVEPGSEVSENVTLGISASVESGYYELPFNVTLSTGQKTAQRVGILVRATPELTITAETSQGVSTPEIVLQISNTGNTPIRSVYVVAEYGGSTTEKFIGTLDLDDYSTVTLTSTAFGGIQAGNRTAWQTDGQTRQAEPTVNVMISFRDEQNQPHTIMEEIKVGAARQAASTTSTIRQRGDTGVLFGLSWLQIGAVILTAGVAYLLYRRTRKKKKV